MSTHPKVSGKTIPSDPGVASIAGDFFPPGPAVRPRPGRNDSQAGLPHAPVPSRSGR